MINVQKESTKNGGKVEKGANEQRERGRRQSTEQL
jgi:hypothetical protein